MSQNHDGTIFFFECSNEKEKKDILFAFFVNLHWARRFSGLFFPREETEFSVEESDFSLDYLPIKESYVRSHRQPKSFQEGELEMKSKKKLDSRFKTSFFQIKNSSIEICKKKGAQPFESADLKKAEIFLIFNEINKKNALDSFNWFLLSVPDGYYVFKCASTPNLEVWCKTLNSHTLSFIV